MRKKLLKVSVICTLLLILLVYVSKDRAKIRNFVDNTIKIEFKTISDIESNNVNDLLKVKAFKKLTNLNIEFDESYDEGGVKILGKVLLDGGYKVVSISNFKGYLQKLLVFKNYDYIGDIDMRYHVKNSPECRYEEIDGKKYIVAGSLKDRGTGIRVEEESWYELNDKIEKTLEYPTVVYSLISGSSGFENYSAELKEADFDGVENLKLKYKLNYQFEDENYEAKSIEQEMNLKKEKNLLSIDREDIEKLIVSEEVKNKIIEKNYYELISFAKHADYRNSEAVKRLLEDLKEPKAEEIRALINRTPLVTFKSVHSIKGKPGLKAKMDFELDQLQNVENGELICEYYNGSEESKKTPSVLKIQNLDSDSLNNQFSFNIKASEDKLKVELLNGENKNTKTYNVGKLEDFIYMNLSIDEKRRLFENEENIIGVLIINQNEETWNLEHIKERKELEEKLANKKYVLIRYEYKRAEK